MGTKNNMRVSDRIQASYRGLRTNMSRTLLTILGIVIGITAIIIVVSMGQGAQDLILSQIQGLGSRTIIIEPGREPRGPADFSEMYTESLKQRELDALMNSANVQGVEYVAPMVIQVVPVNYENEISRTNVLGSSADIANVLDIYADDGDILQEDDIRNHTSVAVLGSEVKIKLFGESDAVGERIKMNGRSYLVIGTIHPKGQVGFLDVDHMVLIPYTTAQQYITGSGHFSALFARAIDEDSVPRVVRDIELTLRELHGIDDPDKDDFHATTQADAMEIVGVITGALTALLSSVAAISLVVGGIGIMNIMLVSVAERTREIGLRKALGATDTDILSHFLLESVILTVFGGIIGILMGSLLSFLASLILTKVLGRTWSFTFPISAALLGLGVSASVGLVFGIYPAKKASRKSPIEALRYE